MRGVAFLVHLAVSFKVPDRGRREDGEPDAGAAVPGLGQPPDRLRLSHRRGPRVSRGLQGHQQLAQERRELNSL